MSRARARVMRKGSTEPSLVDAWVEPATPDNNGPLVVQKWRDARGEYLTTMMVETMEEGSHEVGFLKSKYHLGRRSAEIHAPYRIKEEGDKFKVVNDLGETKGTHDSWDDARQHQEALYANVPGASEMAKEKKEQREKAARRAQLDDLLDGPARPEIEGEDPEQILNKSRAMKRRSRMVPIICMTCNKRFKVATVTESLKCRCGSNDLDLDTTASAADATEPKYELGDRVEFWDGMEAGTISFKEWREPWMADDGEQVSGQWNYRIRFDSGPYKFVPESSIDRKVGRKAMIETDVPMLYVDEYQPQLAKLPENDTFAEPFKDESDEGESDLKEAIDKVTDQIAATYAKRKTANGLVDVGGGWVQNGDDWLLFESEGVGEGDVDLHPRPGPVAEYNWSAFTYDTLPYKRIGVAKSVEEAKERVEEYIRSTMGTLFAKKISQIASDILKTNPALGEKRAQELARKTVDRFPQVIKGK